MGEAILLGRNTYEMFAPVWSTRTAEDDPGAPFFNDTPKYVVSSTLQSADWKNSSVLGPYSASVIRELKDRVDGSIYVSGSGTLVRALLADGLVDELHLFVFPGRRASPVRLSARARLGSAPVRRRRHGQADPGRQRGLRQRGTARHLQPGWMSRSVACGDAGMCCGARTRRGCPAVKRSGKIFGRGRACRSVRRHAIPASTWPLRRRSTGPGIQARQVCASVRPGPVMSSPAKNEAMSSGVWLMNGATALRPASSAALAGRVFRGLALPPPAAGKCELPHARLPASTTDCGGVPLARGSRYASRASLRWPHPAGGSSAGHPETPWARPRLARWPPPAARRGTALNACLWLSGYQRPCGPRRPAIAASRASSPSGGPDS